MTDRGCHFPMWPDNARPTHEYCGKARIEGQPYCAEHFKRTRSRAQPVEKAEAEKASQ